MTEKVLKIVKAKIADGTVEDDEIISAIDEIGFYIKEYCHIDAIPNGLLYTWANMAYEMHMKKLAFQFGQSTSSQEADDSQEVKSFSVDGIGMTFETASDKESQQIKNYQAHKNIENLLLDYTRILNRYRKLVW